MGTFLSWLIKVVMVSRIFRTPDSGREQVHPWEHEPCGIYGTHDDPRTLCSDSNRRPGPRAITVVWGAYDSSIFRFAKFSNETSTHDCSVYTQGP